MLNNLKPQAPDKILALMGQFRADPRADKIDLGVGVYKDATGLTPVMRAVKAAEKQLWEAETTKTYTALAGEPAYHAAMAGMILGAGYPADRVAALATVGGTGAIRQALELIRMANPDATIWVSDPTWPNHLTILAYLGMKTRLYRYFDADTRGVNFAGMMDDLKEVKAGDVVLLHGCCHNPTGANLNLTEWAAVADLLERSGAMPLIDLAYQGFGDGLDADAAGTRLIAARLPQVLIAASCSKNFGIYRERTGILLALAPDTATRDLAQGTMAYLNRQNYSFAPDHGARLVTMILTDASLRKEWETELEQVRLSMLGLREQLASELRALAGSDRFGFIAQHRGMFSRLGASPEQVERLRAEHGIYMVGDSRLNIAGLNATTVPILARAIIDCGI
ncbi:aromatic amino acid aminotransferase [Rhodobacter veldkampii DSM 11550]|uniref:Aromatic amino acid aminotransferase n=1 Tax=Phaeovulum veldkampii DSM 11550 TaxID=1185920 RepID=A0A2T4JLE1_9RHOB|nr:amino acid aminotransferase [Phaeovulum veldkampii]MBK5944956.1 aromatic amino acid aminotransferase [Phaeovulum veldkampii DSM 11550]PTE18714.1 aromatic amino acid aminotransferase [Phaeovulum veldkampii DSM 11550]TDQ57243.1 aromatic amino acid aminotransferase [Phaeovulum veldkampii DSM 11550]